MEKNKQNQRTSFEQKYSLKFVPRKSLVFSQSNVKTADSISGKPLIYWKDIAKRFFSNKFALISTFLIIAIIAMAIIIPVVTIYDPITPVSKFVPSLIANLPPHSLDGGSISRSIYDGADPLITVLKNAHISYTINDSNIHNMIVTFNPWDAMNANDMLNHRVYLGTDSAGFDIWTRLWVGTAYSLKLAFLVVAIEATIGITVGAYIGFHAYSTLDTILMRFIDIVGSVPALIWFILFMFILTPGFWTMVIALSVIGWMPFVNITRMFILRIKDAEYIQAAKAIGVSKAGLIYRHALPNIIGKLLMRVVRTIPRIIFIEATLAFLGLSPNTQDPTLGNLFNDAKSHLSQWWYITAPTVLLLVFTISMQLIALALHDAFDPRTSVK